MFGVVLQWLRNLTHDVEVRVGRHRVEPLDNIALRPSTMECALVYVSVFMIKLAYRCDVRHDARTTLLASRRILGVFASSASTFSSIALSSSSSIQATNLYRQSQCLMLVLLVSPSGHVLADQ